MLRTPAACILLVLAGCGAVPPRSEPIGAVELAATNEADRPYRLDVTVVPPAVDGLLVRYENGSSRRFDVASMAALPGRALRNATAVEPVGAAGRHRGYRLEPDTGVGETIGDVPAGATVVYFLATGDGRRRSAGRTSCGPDAERLSLSITVRAGGEVHASTRCSG